MKNFKIRSNYLNSENKTPDHITIIVGGSGSGKTHLSKAFENAGYYLSISHTTRTLREKDGEIHGKDYFFVSEKDFNALNLVESEKFKGNYYGSAEEQVNPRITKKPVVIVTEVNGAISIIDWAKENGIYCNVISTDARNREEAMRSRGDNEESIQSRMNDGINALLIHKVENGDIVIDIEIEDFLNEDEIAQVIEYDKKIIKQKHLHLSHSISKKENMCVPSHF